MRASRPVALRVPALDFVAGPARPPWMAWLLLSCGLLVAALAATDLLAARTRLDEEAARVERWQAQLQRPRTPTAPPAGREGAGAEAARASAWQVAAALRHPWTDLLGMLEGATPAGIRWTMLEHDAARPELRLEGMARDSAAALALVDELAVQPLVAAALLNRLDRGGANAAGVRFEIELRLDNLARP